MFLVFKAFYEQNLAQKSSLTTSDFIRVVGSDNVSYKQGMSTVASVINSAQPIGSHSGSIKQWALQLNGQAITATSPTTTTDLPDISNKYGLAWTKSIVSGNNKWVHLYWSPTNVNDIYICSNIGNADNWTAWQKMPTRTEVDALTSRIQGFSNGSSGGTATLPITARGIIAVMSVERSASIDRSNEGFGLIKNYNNNAYLTRVTGLSGFSTSMADSSHVVVTMPAYTNVMLIIVNP